MLSIAPHVLLQLQRVPNAREQQDVRVLTAQFIQGYLFSAVHMGEFSIADAAVEKELEGLQMQGRAYHAISHRFDVRGTFGDDDDVGTVLAFCFLSETSGWQQTVIGNHAVIVDE